MFRERVTDEDGFLHKSILSPMNLDIKSTILYKQ